MRCMPKQRYPNPFRRRSNNCLSSTARRRRRHLNTLSGHLAPLLHIIALKLPLDLLNLSGLGVFDVRGLFITAAQLPFHQLSKSALFIRGEFLIGAFFGDFAVGADANDAVGTLDRRQTMGDADGSIFLLEELA
jgi:hypothetical protein